ncbi:MAG: AgmX/PglI C-terminal domain-containing protein [Archangium sp.]|nr:AgmX/PglI C-terminal domain-containing protein [Archangium sp.]
MRCYAPIIKEGGTLQGKVVLQLDVNRTGGVRSVKKLPATTIEDAGLVSCVMATIKGWSFPKNTAVLEVPLQIRQVIK